ncbi:MAG: diguanylate cyclase [Desulfocapsaceae bacterium]|nr:diguanylate cyclase [Desulfocapsaceae bacterium]
MKNITPLKLFFYLTLLIGITEYGIMSFLAMLSLSPLAAGLLDSGLLLLTLFPFLYLLVYRPFQKNILQLMQTKGNIESIHHHTLTVLNSIDAIVYVADMETYEVLFINDYMKKIFGDITGQVCWKSIQIGQSGPCPFCTNDKLIDTDGLPLEMYRWEFQNTTNGHWYDIHDRAIRWIDGRIVRLEIATDITQRKESEEKIQQQNHFLQSVIESLPYPFYVIDMNSYEIELSNTMAALAGIKPGKKCFTATHNSESPCNSEEHECPLNLVKTKREPVTVEHVHHNRAGEEEYVEIHGYPITDKNGVINKMIEIQIDITERKKAEEKLQQISITDEMTGLYNRRGFLILGEKQIQLADRTPGKIYVIYADCNKLKLINDTLGHKMGDEFIQETAVLLKETFRMSDIIGRLGGDEFVVLLVEEAGKESEAILKARLTEAIARRNQQPGRKFPFSISYGISCYDRENPSSLEKLLSQADRHMYQNKKGLAV